MQIYPLAYYNSHEMTERKILMKKLLIKQERVIAWERQNNSKRIVEFPGKCQKIF